MFAQVVLGAFFGDASPGQERKPILVGSHASFEFSYSNFWRGLVGGGPFEVLRGPAPNAKSLLRVIKEAVRCSGGDHKGRWVNVGDGPCEPPLCTGNHKETVNAIDWVRCYV